MGNSASGATSCAVILSGYGKKETPVDTADYLEANYGYPKDTVVESLVDTLNHFGVAAKSSEGNIEEIRKAWSEGKPVIYNAGPGEITNQGHYFVILGETDGGVIISQVAGNNYSYIKNNYIYNGTLEELVSKTPLKAIIVPEKAPEKAQSLPENTDNKNESDKNENSTNTDDNQQPDKTNQDKDSTSTDDSDNKTSESKDKENDNKGLDKDGKEEDKTTATGKLPQTGVKTLIIPIVVISVLGAVVYFKYKKYKEI